MPALWVEDGGAIDQEAAARGLSVRLLEREIPMLPPELTDACRLTADEARPVLILSVRPGPRAGAAGGCACPWGRARPRAALEAGEGSAPVRRLAALAEGRRQRRRRAGAWQQLHPADRIAVREGRAAPAAEGVEDRIDSELRLLAAEAIARLCRDAAPAIHAAREAPPAESGIPGATDSTSAEVLRTHLLEGGAPRERLGTPPAPHAGLGLPACAPGASPLSSYVDLAMQRQLLWIAGRRPDPLTAEDLERILLETREAREAAERVRRGSRRYWDAQVARGLRGRGAPGVRGRRTARPRAPGTAARGSGGVPCPGPPGAAAAGGAGPAPAGAGGAGLRPAGPVAAGRPRARPESGPAPPGLRMLRAGPSAALAGACWLLAGAAAAGEPETEASRFWPAWRGPLGTGASPHAEPPLRWSQTRNLRWKASLPGGGHSTPVVWGDRVFITAAVPYGEPLPPTYSGLPGGHDERPVTHRHRFVVLALSRTTGRVLWQRVVRHDLPRAGGHYTASLASASAVTDGEHLVASFGSHGIYGLDLEGELLWELDLGPMDPLHGHGEGSSPALTGGTLIVNWDHEGESFLAAFDKRTGALRWKAPREPASSWTTPIVTDAGGRTQVVVSGSGGVRGYDLADGRRIWECPGLSVENVVATPVAGFGLVFAGSSYDRQAVLAIPLQPAADEDRRAPPGRLEPHPGGAVRPLLPALRGRPLLRPPLPEHPHPRRRPNGAGPAGADAPERPRPGLRLSRRRCRPRVRHQPQRRHRGGQSRRLARPPGRQPSRRQLQRLGGTGRRRALPARTTPPLLHRGASAPGPVNPAGAGGVNRVEAGWGRATRSWSAG